MRLTNEEKELSKRMVDMGMFSLEHMLEGNIMGEFSTHVGVSDFDSLLKWVEHNYRSYLKMRIAYELGDKDKNDDMFEWVFAHCAAFEIILDHLRKVN